jgi:regulator of RNase E activity RraA
MARSSNVGFRVFTRIARPSPEIVKALGEIDSNYISDAMNRFGGMAGDIRPADPAMRMAGPAITVRVPPGDVLMVFQAFEVAQPGDVIVIESRGYTAVSQWGDITSMLGQARGLAGMVTDGSLRDLQGILRVGFPVFARNYLLPGGSLHDGPGEVNVPVAVGNVPVLPGDIVIGDHNGVVVVPRLDAEAVLDRARSVVGYERLWIAGFAEGHLTPDWLAHGVAGKGCEIIDGEYPYEPTRD